MFVDSDSGIRALGGYGSSSSMVVGLHGLLAELGGRKVAETRIPGQEVKSPCLRYVDRLHASIVPCS